MKTKSATRTVLEKSLVQKFSQLSDDKQESILNVLRAFVAKDIATLNALADNAPNQGESEAIRKLISSMEGGE